ncbi:hypothetical protein IEO70_14815 [Bacillus sp. AGMB 02131]|uniref:Uncharacterized protein n=1 Tax=Peribacillus faecalis TaxID=2772559 RepID=A0A927CZQ1_9BACI|nr:hypothetical protein [Peribacillus faecalis]MBD3109617.1 hypothetical protein [Peribacillus faecalis]
MYSSYEKKHIFMVMAFGIALMIPVLLLFLPATIADVLFYNRANWIIYLPFEVYLTYGVGLALWFLSSLLLWLLNLNKWSFLFTGIAVICSGALFYFASQTYVIIKAESIAVKPLFQSEEKVYTWNEVEKLVYYEVSPEEKGNSIIHLQLADDEVIELSENGYVASIKSAIFDKVRGLEKEVVYTNRYEK